MKEPSIWMWWYLMLLSVPLMVLMLFVEDWIKRPARQERRTRN